MNRLQALHDVGVSIWLDNLSDCAVTGATSNPTIFAKAITGSDRYDDQLHDLVGSGIDDPQELFFQLALDDVRHQELLGRIEAKVAGKDLDRADANYSRAVRAGGRRN